MNSTSASHGVMFRSGRILPLATTLLCLASTAWTLELHTWTVDGGGGRSIGGGFSLTGNVGQPDVGTASGGGYEARGGFFSIRLDQTGVDPPPEPQLPLVHRLYHNSPNPFRGATRIRFDLPDPGPVNIRVFDLHGRLVKTLASGSLPAGKHEVSWTGTSNSGVRLPGGVYIVQMIAAKYVERHKVVMLR